MIATTTDMRPLEVLHDVEGSARSGRLPPELATAYGGDLVLSGSAVYANMVSTIDGVAAERTRPRSSRDISGGDPSDRFVMGLLRAHADAIVIGAGTLRAHPSGAWTAEAAYPAASEAFAALRTERARAGRPRLVVLSASGDVPPHDALPGSIVISSERGAGRLRDDVAERVDVRVVPSDERGLDVASTIQLLRSQGDTRILTEGGPRLLGSFLAASALDDLFLTISPKIAGRSDDGRRPGVVDGFELPAGTFAEATLRSARRSGSFLFLRYGLSDRPADRPDVGEGR
jgi:riboflavin biosynthesis pyrimidine reductase